MKRTVLVGALLAVLAFTFGGNASAGVKNFWVGKSSQREPLEFLTGTVGGQRYVAPLDMIFDVSCPITGDQFTFEFAFFGFQVPLSHGQFDLSFPDLQIPFDWQGTIADMTASGTQSLGFAAYDTQGGLQDCGTGTLSWHAKPVGSAPVKGTGTMTKGHVLVQLVREKDGRIKETISTIR